MPSHSFPFYNQKFVGVNFQMFAVNAILVNVEAMVEADKSVYWLQLGWWYQLPRLV